MVISKPTTYDIHPSYRFYEDARCCQQEAGETFADTCFCEGACQRDLKEIDTLRLQLNLFGGVA